MADRGGPDAGEDRHRADEALRVDIGDVGRSLGSALDGDFYTFEEAVRGVNLPDITCNDFPDIAGEAALVQGDFYALKQDTVRGLSLGMFSGTEVEVPTTCSDGFEVFVPPGMPQGTDLPCMSGAWVTFAPPSPLSSLYGALVSEQAESHVDAPRFDEVDTPPSTPTDDFFTFMVTTLFVSGISAARIGNVLLDFFVASALARLEKVSPRQFSIKAEVRVDESLSCMLKIRLYRKESECAVEFRRCSGDSVLFNACFRQAWDKLVTCGEAKVRV